MYKRQKKYIFNPKNTSISLQHHQISVVPELMTSKPPLSTMRLGDKDIKKKYKEKED